MAQHLRSMQINIFHPDRKYLRTGEALTIINILIFTRWKLTMRERALVPTARRSLLSNRVRGLSSNCTENHAKAVLPTVYSFQPSKILNQYKNTYQ